MLLETFSAMLLNQFEQPCCVFCGNRLHRKYNRSTVSVSDVQAFTRTHCSRSKFHFSAIMALQDERVGICSVCRAWQRRVARRTEKKSPTPIDHLIKIVISPGSGSDLDQRNWATIAHAAMHTENVFVNIIPLPVKLILEEMLKSSAATDHRVVLAKAWYTHNESPVFFNDGKLAAIMKRFVRE